MKESGSIFVLTEKTSSTGVIEFEDYKQWVYDHLLKADNIALRPMVVALLEDSNKLLRKSENGVVSSRRKFCETITSNASDPVFKLLIIYHKTFN